MVDSVVLCDATIEFTGTPYTGLCPECDFLFEVETTLTRDDGSGACPYQKPFTLYSPSAQYTDPTLLGFAPMFSFPPFYLYDVLVAGITTVDFHGTVYGPAITPVTFGFPSMYATVKGDTLDRLVDFSKGGKYPLPYSHYPYNTYCTFDTYTTATGPYGAGSTTYGSLPCDAGYSDVFTFEGYAGSTAYITVDTTTDKPAPRSADVGLRTRLLRRALGQQQLLLLGRTDELPLDVGRHGRGDVPARGRAIGIVHRGAGQRRLPSRRRSGLGSDAHPDPRGRADQRPRHVRRDRFRHALQVDRQRNVSRATARRHLAA